MLLTKESLQICCGIVTVKEFHRTKKLIQRTCHFNVCCTLVFFKDKLNLRALQEVKFSGFECVIIHSYLNFFVPQVVKNNFCSDFTMLLEVTKLLVTLFYERKH